MNKIDVESRIARPSMRVDPAATCQQGVGSSSISDAAVFPAPPVDATGIRDFEGADVGRLPVAGQYPPRRTPEMNRRIAAHEVGGHGFLARVLGNSVLYCTILPGGGFEGRCVRAGHLSDRIKHGTHHKLSVDFNNMPKGTRTAYSGQPGLFKEVKLNRGRAMGFASQDS